MKTWITLLLISFFPMIGLSQLSEPAANAADFRNVSIKGDTVEASPSVTTESQKAKLKFGMSFGTYFATNFNGGYSYGTSLNPQLSYPLSPRFSLSAGAQINTLLGNSFYQAYDPMAYPGYSYHPTQSLLFVEGAYKLNEKLTVRGAAFKQVSLFKNPHSLQLNNNSNYQGVIMGMDYKVGKNVFIQGQIEISNGRGYYPYSNTPGTFPGDSPFRTGHSLVW